MDPELLQQHQQSQPATQTCRECGLAVTDTRVEWYYKFSDARTPSGWWRKCVPCGQKRRVLRLFDRT